MGFLTFLATTYHISCNSELNRYIFLLTFLSLCREHIAIHSFRPCPLFTFLPTFQNVRQATIFHIRNRQQRVPMDMKERMNEISSLNGRCYKNFLNIESVWMEGIFHIGIIIHWRVIPSLNSAVLELLTSREIKANWFYFFFG